MLFCVLVFVFSVVVDSFVCVASVSFSSLTTSMNSFFPLSPTLTSTPTHSHLLLHLIQFWYDPSKAFFEDACHHEQPLSVTKPGNALDWCPAETIREEKETSKSLRWLAGPANKAAGFGTKGETFAVNDCAYLVSQDMRENEERLRCSKPYEIVQVINSSRCCLGLLPLSLAVCLSVLCFSSVLFLRLSFSLCFAPIELNNNTTPHPKPCPRSLTCSARPPPHPRQSPTLTLRAWTVKAPS